MASTPTGVSALDGLFKDQFHKDVENLIPDHVILQKGMIDWVPADKQNGQFYSVPTLLRSNQGVSYLGTAGAGTTALNDATAGVMKEAQVSGFEINVRGRISYKALSQAATQGPRAFKKASAWLVEDLAQVAYTRVEIASLYGQSSIGEVLTQTDAGGGVTNVVVTEDSWAPGIWVLAEGAYLDSFTGTTKNNTGTLLLNSVATSTRTLNITYSGTIANDCAVGDILFFQGAAVDGGTFNEMIGLYKQFSDVSSQLFGITRSSYSLMQPNVYSSTGALSRTKIVEAAMRAVDKGCMSDLVVLVGTKAWAALAAEDYALRVFDSSYSTGKSQTGSKEMLIESVNGSLKIICHPFVKQSHAFIFNPEDTLYVGSSKPTFEIPGFGGEKFFTQVPDYSQVELQNFSDMAIYHLKPCQAVMMTGISYS